MLKDEEIKIIMKSLNDNFDKQKEKYENAKHSIQDLCNHNELSELLGGRVCNICGKYFPYDNRINKLVKREYIEKNYWKYALEVCKKFAIESNLSGEDIVKALRKVRKEYEE